MELIGRGDLKLLLKNMDLLGWLECLIGSRGFLLELCLDSTDLEQIVYKMDFSTCFFMVKSKTSTMGALFFLI